MGSTSMLRKLRIAFSVACGIFSVLLIALWARSYYRCDSFHVGRELQITSLRGKLYVDGQFHMSESRFVANVPGISWSEYSNRFYHGGVTAFGKSSTIPVWLPILLVMIFATVPWTLQSPRYSLRTLLIATTLVAVVLGLFVAFA